MMETKMKNGKRLRVMNGDNSYCYLAVEDVFSEYQLPKMEGVDIRERWDGHRAEEIIVEYLKVSGLVPNMPPNQVNQELLRRTMERVLGDGAWCCPRPIEGIDDPSSTIIQISGKLNVLKDYAGCVSQDLIKEAEIVGGDDSYYDYFPGYAQMFRSICLDLGMQELYEQTIETIERGRYVDDEDEETLPHWYEIKE